MKYILILSLVAITNLYTNAQAALISDIQAGVEAYATDVTGSNGAYFDQTFVTPGDYSSPATDEEVAAAVTGGDLTSYVRTFDANLFSTTEYLNDRYIDLSFGNIAPLNGVGADIVLFFAGNATKFLDGHIEKYLFAVESGGVKSDLLGVTTSGTSDIYNNKFYASYALIDLSDFGYADNAAIDDLRIYLGDSSMPSLAAAGAYNTATVVPLPLSSVLFGSGLAVLSLFRRKHKA